jgi:hypothetical protein
MIFIRVSGVMLERMIMSQALRTHSVFGAIQARFSVYSPHLNSPFCGSLIDLQLRRRCRALLRL